MALAIVLKPGLPWSRVLRASSVGALIGVFIGVLVAKLGIPSFVVTLAFFLGLQGVTLKLIGMGGTVPLDDPVIRAITIKNMPVAGRLDRGHRAAGALRRARCSIASRGSLQRPWPATRSASCSPGQSRACCGRTARDHLRC